jgi:hypothetical protein
MRAPRKRTIFRTSAAPRESFFNEFPVQDTSFRNTILKWIILLGTACLPVTAFASSLSDSDIAHVYGQIEQRRDAVLANEIGSPFPSPVCGRASGPDPCVLGQLNHALAQFYLSRNANEIAAANAEIASAVVAIPQAPAFKANAPELANLPEKGEASDEFHFQKAGFLYRIVKLFGADGIRARGRLSPTNESAIKALFWDWAKDDCRLADADPRNIWSPWKSENHDAQLDGACWSAAELLKGMPQYADQRYGDGSLASAQYARWTSYLQAYLKARARYGLIEYFSPTYAVYTLTPIYNLADFGSDTTLKRLAHAFLDLWWSEWAEEQSGGEFGGAQTRTYAKTIADGSPLRGAAWLYFGIGGSAQDGRPPGLAAAVTSSYAPAPVTADIALDTAGRGTYEVMAGAPGVLADGTSDSRGGRRFVVDPTKPGVLRIATVTPDFVLGSADVAKLPADRWIPASSQNRWAGLVMADNPQSRIVLRPQADKGESDYNALWAIQHGGTLIAQEAPPPYGKNVGDMRVWFGSPLSRSERDGWVFVEGTAYAAMRPVSGGYRWDSENPGWLVLNDRTSPVVLHAARKSAYPDLAAFQSAVLAAKVDQTVDALNVQVLGSADRLTWYPRSARAGEIEGVPPQLSAGTPLQSPFIRENWAASTVTIMKGGRSESLNFQI